MSTRKSWIWCVGSLSYPFYSEQNLLAYSMTFSRKFRWNFINFPPSTQESKVKIHVSKKSHKIEINICFPCISIKSLSSHKLSIFIQPIKNYLITCQSKLFTFFPIINLQHPLVWFIKSKERFAKILSKTQSKHHS